MNNLLNRVKKIEEKLKPKEEINVEVQFFSGVIVRGDKILIFPVKDNKTLTPDMVEICTIEEYRKMIVVHDKDEDYFFSENEEEELQSIFEDYPGQWQTMEDLKAWIEIINKK